MSTMQAPVMIADGVQIIEKITLALFWQGLLPGAPLAATAAFGYVGSHIKPSQGKVHQSGELVALLPHLPEAFQVNDEDIGECPQAEFDHALLKDLAVGTAPGIIWSQLQRRTQYNYIGAWARTLGDGWIN